MHFHSLLSSSNPCVTPPAEHRGLQITPNPLRAHSPNKHRAQSEGHFYQFSGSQTELCLGKKLDKMSTFLFGYADYCGTALWWTSLMCILALWTSPDFCFLSMIQKAGVSCLRSCLNDFIKIMSLVFAGTDRTNVDQGISSIEPQQQFHLLKTKKEK